MYIYIHTLHGKPQIEPIESCSHKPQITLCRKITKVSSLISLPYRITAKLPSEKVYPSRAGRAAAPSRCESFC